MNNLNLAVIGNCSYSALIDSHARIVWCCLPRFDSEPQFSSLLNNSAEDAQGVFAVDLLDVASSTQRYRPNTAIVETELRDETGSAIRQRHSERTCAVVIKMGIRRMDRSVTSLSLIVGLLMMPAGILAISVLARAFALASETILDSCFIGA